MHLHENRFVLISAYSTPLFSHQLSGSDYQSRLEPEGEEECGPLPRSESSLRGVHNRDGFPNIMNQAKAIWTTPTGLIVFDKVHFL